MVQFISTSKIYFSEIIRSLHVYYFQNFKKLIEIYINWVEFSRLIKKKKNLRRRMVPDVFVYMYVCACTLTHTSNWINTYIHARMCACAFTRVRVGNFKVRVLIQFEKDDYYYIFKIVTAILVCFYFSILYFSNH